MQPSHPSFIAHRGASYDAPENTLAAIHLAWEQHADAVEVDIHLSKDNKIVVIHDDTTGRTTGANHNVRDLTLAELRNLDAGAWKGSQWANQRIPALDEVLAAVPGDKRIFIEIKCRESVLPILKAVLRASALRPDQVTLIGFDLSLMTQAKKLVPEYEICFLFHLQKDIVTHCWRPDPEHIISSALSAGVDGVDLFACDAVDENFVKKARNAGLKIYVWTVNNVTDAQRFVALNLDGITSDRAGWLKFNCCTQ
ncbi:MAG: glycerophosphodiester phosphodiesterase [Candidatus Zhuqueibacterota bacterium]